VVGKEVTVSVRPECWTLTGTPTPRNSVRGKVGESVYLGEVAQHDFVAGANQLKIYELNPAEQGKNGRGELHAAVNPQDVVILLS
ncbi:MAG TPA: spermidine/putrescine ABC transporter ATP-binding protein, partial [Opitutaceae bacterium]|nr:spermidine/putrescine ABC transporter ATP-binding protein [Opitutaceae bacterium]